MSTLKEKLHLKKICKSLSKPLCIALIVVILVFVLALIFTSNINSFITVGVATFFGAAAAFCLHIWHDKSKQKLKNEASLVRTEFVIDAISSIHNSVNKHMEDWQSARYSVCFSWEKIQRYDFSSWYPNIDVERLLFLLEDNKDGKETLKSLLLVDAESQDVRHIVRRRNQNYVAYLDKTKDREFTNENELISIIGPRLFQELTEDTKRLIDTNRNLLEDCKKAKEKINDFLKNY